MSNIGINAYKINTLLECSLHLSLDKLPLVHKYKACIGAYNDYLEEVDRVFAQISDGFIPIKIISRFVGQCYNSKDIIISLGEELLSEDIIQSIIEGEITDNERYLTCSVSQTFPHSETHRKWEDKWKNSTYRDILLACEDLSSEEYEEMEEIVKKQFAKHNNLDYTTYSEYWDNLAIFLHESYAPTYIVKLK